MSYTRSSYVYIGDINISFYGDFRQLSSVNATTVNRAPRSMIRGVGLWQSFNYDTIQLVMWQSDATFSSILTQGGNGERLDVDGVH
ncbi:hypothetical protein TNCV_1910341 [Trichonephila clavipes]|nr:hypothetical protein TNCV_1910341 [Trichonephila clavipes]